MAGYYSYYKYSANMNDRTYFTSVVTNTAGNIKRYFSNVESEIYFGSKEMEDIYQFQFSIDEKVLPIYGYNGYHASELVSGQRIIQGQFILNYTNEQEIKTTLGEIDSSVYESVLADDYHPSGGSMSDPIYNKLFDIMIGYGYYSAGEKQTYNATSQTIIGCKISSMQKVIDSTGQPIMEVYNFIAMDFIEENIVESSYLEKNKNNLEYEKVKPPNSNEVIPINGSDIGTKIESDAIGQINSYGGKVVANFVNYNLGIISIDANNLTTADGQIIIHAKDAMLEIKAQDILDKNKLNYSSGVMTTMEFSSTCENVATIDLNSKYPEYVPYFNQAKNKKVEYILCSLKYKATLIEGTESGDYVVDHYLNCKIYL